MYKVKVAIDKKPNTKPKRKSQSETHCNEKNRKRIKVSFIIQKLLRPQTERIKIKER